MKEYLQLIDSIQKAIDVLDTTPSEGIEAVSVKYKRNYLVKNLELVKNTPEAGRDEVAYMLLIGRLKTEAEKTLTHNTQKGAFKGASTMRAILKHY